MYFLHCVCTVHFNQRNSSLEKKDLKTGELLYLFFFNNSNVIYVIYLLIEIAEASMKYMTERVYYYTDISKLLSNALTIKITFTSAECSSRHFFTLTPHIALILKCPNAVINATAFVAFLNAAHTQISAASPFFDIHRIFFN